MVEVGDRKLTGVSLKFDNKPAQEGLITLSGVLRTKKVIRNYN
jgi:hypothetical protein